MDAALVAHAEATNSVVSRIHVRARGDAAPASIPTFTTATRVGPETDSTGRAAYSRPHVRFELANDRVRELLMGQTLYEDPGSALRELYQNALDACRYRAARREYLARTRGQVEPWEGRVAFRRAVDDGGRHYVECEDNGVGMGVYELGELFAKAGRRFAESPDFIEEADDWLACDPPIELSANSQFGIGVFSYFMLADEVEVETCRYERDGSLGPRHHISISSGASLFRIRSSTPSGAPGTRVRLYLTPEHRNLDCIAKLTAVLWVAEFETTVEQGPSRHHWKAGQPSSSIRSALLGEPLTLWPSGRRDLWWAIDEWSGRVLIDGLATGSGILMTGDGGLPGVVADVSGADAPRLTANRTKILGWNPENVRKRVETAPVLPPGEAITYDWLMQVSAHWPLLTDRLLVACAGRSLALDRPFLKGSSAPIDELGCFPPDAEILESVEHFRTMPGSALRQLTRTGRYRYLYDGFLPIRCVVARLWALHHHLDLPDAVRSRVASMAAWLEVHQDELREGTELRAALDRGDVQHVPTAAHRDVPLVQPTRLIPGDELLLSAAPEDTSGTIVRVACRTGRTIRDVVERVDALRGYGLARPAGLPSDPGPDWVPPRDLEPYVEPLTRAGLLAYGATKGRTFGETRDLLDPLRELGCALDIPQQLVDSNIPLADLALLRVAPLGDVYRARLGLTDIAAEAMRVQQSLAEVAERVAWMRTVGIEVADVGDLGELVPTGSDPAILEGLDPGLDMPHPAFIAGVDLSEVVARLQEWRPDDPRLTAIDASALTEVYIGLSDQFSLSANLDGRPPWVWPEVGAEHLRAAATARATTASELRDRLARLAPLGLIVPSSEELT